MRGALEPLLVEDVSVLVQCFVAFHDVGELVISVQVYFVIIAFVEIIHASIRWGLGCGEGAVSLVEVIWLAL